MTFQSDIDKVTARELRRFIENQGGVLLRQEGSHKWYEIQRPGHKLHGTRVPCIDDNQPVSRNLTAAVAKKFGRDRTWLLRQLGVEVHKGGKVKRGIDVATAIGRRDVLDAIDNVRHQLERYEQAISTGQRSSAFYERMFGHIDQARRELERLILEVAS